MITFKDFILASAYTKDLNKYFKVEIYQPNVCNPSDEFVPIEINIENLIKYGEYRVSDICIDYWEDKRDFPKISILISHPDTKFLIV